MIDFLRSRWPKPALLVAIVLFLLGVVLNVFTDADILAIFLVVVAAGIAVLNLTVHSHS